MSQRERWTLAILLTIAIAALALLAAALPSVRLAPGKPFPLDLFVPAPQTTPSPGGSIGFNWLGVLLLVLASFAVLVAVFSPDFRRWLVRTLPGYLLFAFVLYLFLANLRQCTGELRGPATGPGAFGPERPAPGEAAAVTPPELVSNPPDWLITIISLVLATGLIWLAFRLARLQPARRAAGDQGAEIAAEARAALRDLEAGADVRDAVTRCYIEMVRVLRAERGIARDPDMTAREFEQRLARTGLGDAHIRRLTRLFEVVRYSPHTPGPRETREAEACLHAIIEAYSEQPASR